MGESFSFDDTSIREYKFSELFDMKEIQKLQDLFSAALGVVSIITEPDGTPITKPSGLGSSYTEIIKDADSIFVKCLGKGLLEGCAKIFIDGQYLADWFVGQIFADYFNNRVKDKVNEQESNKIKSMSKLQLEKICDFLSFNVRQLSNYALKNILLTTELKNKILNEVEITNLNQDLKQWVKLRAAQLEENNAELEEINAMLEESNAELEESNALLEEEIRKRLAAEEATRKLNEELENKVRERTNQLQDMNILLEEEIIEKIKTEYELSQERFFTDALFNSVPGIIYLYDDRNKLMRWNKKHEEVTGYSSHELAQMDLFAWYQGDKASQEAVREGLGKVVLNGFGDAEAYLQKKDGSKIPMYFTACPVIIEGKQYFAGIGIDMTERKRMLERLEKYQVLAEKANDAMLFVDKEGNILEVNDAATRIYGYTYQEFSSLNIFALRPREKAVDVLEQMESADNKGVLFETVHYRKDGSLLNVEVSSQGTFLGNQRVLLSIVRDITDRKRKEDENLYLSYHDVLTGLYNRRFYEEEIKRLNTERNLPISIIMGDVNGLKLANDAFGHSTGDLLLQKAALAIQSACRADDLVARWGGDEFIILLPRTGIEEAEEVVKRIKKTYFDVHVNAIRLSISFGWDTKTKTHEDILKVLKSAEDQMYKHKVVENEGLRGNTINTIINTLHEKNQREEQHSQRVSEICQKIGRALGFSSLEISKLKVVGLLHDIGKIAIEEGILNKPGKLTEDEWNVIRRHPDIGYRILSSSHEMSELADGILAHHERWDGTGYPKGLKGQEIPKVARIIALADSYDAMTSERPYRNALSEEQVLAEILNNAGTQFDPEITKIFIEQVLAKR